MWKIDELMHFHTLWVFSPKLCYAIIFESINEDARSVYEYIFACADVVSRQSYTVYIDIVLKDKRNSLIDVQNDRWLVYGWNDKSNFSFVNCARFSLRKVFLSLARIWLSYSCIHVRCFMLTCHDMHDW